MAVMKLSILVFRAFCEPRVDNVVAIDPTYGMYQVCADVNDVEYRKVLLDEDFQFSADKLLAAADEHTKLIFYLLSQQSYRQ